MKETLVFDHYPLKEKRLPSRWIMSSISVIAQSVTSGFPCGAHNAEGRGIPHIRPMNIDREGRFDLSEVKSVDGEIPRQLRKGDVLFNNTNSPELIGKTTVIPIDAPLAYSNHMTRICLEHGINPSFVAKQLHFLWLSGYFRHQCKNHVNQASIASEPLAQTVPMRIPPAREQARIADALDEFLSDLDAGVAALERARVKLKQYRAAVLKAAVEGALTEEWRKQHPATEPASVLLDRILAERRQRWEEAQLRKFQEAEKTPPKDWKAKYQEPVAPNTTNLPKLPDGWCWARLEQLLLGIEAGKSFECLPRPAEAEEWGIVKVSAMSWGAFDERENKAVPLTRTIDSRYEIRPGDVLLSRANTYELVGASVLVGQCRSRLLLSDKSMRLLHGSLIDPVWLKTMLASPWARSQLSRKSTGTKEGMRNVSQESVLDVVLPVAPGDECQAIIEAVEDQLSVIEHLEADLEAKLKSARALRQSILRHAFEGKLVPQDHNDEPASELLKRIAAARAERERTERQTAGRSRKNPANHDHQRELGLSDP